MDNHILEGNLEQIRRYNPDLAEQISNHNTLQNNIVLYETDLKEPNLSYNSVPIHAMRGADKEAQTIFSQTTDNLNHVHFIYGLGLGYLFKEFADKAKGAIILFEPDIEILRVTLEIVDFSEELAKERIFIVSDFSMLEKIFYSMYAFGSKTKMHFLNFHKTHDPESFNAAKNEITRLNSIIANNTNFQKKNFYFFLNSTIDGLKEKIKVPPLEVLENKFKNIPAVIVSAGPSLTKNIDTLKKMQDKAIIFCVGTAYKTLCEHGIKPDFLNVIEMYDCSTQIEGCETSNMNFISESYTNKAFHDKFKFKSKFMTLSRENITNIWFSDLIGVDNKKYKTRGTVSYNALHSAKMMGCNPIILIGQDLAYTDNKVYADNSPYSMLKIRMNPETNKHEIYAEDLEKYRQAYFPEGHEFPLEHQEYCVNYKLNELNESLVQVKGQDGNLIATEQGYALFIEYFKDFATENKDNIAIINSSIGGAYIDGFAHLPLDAAIEFCKVEKPNINETIKNIDYKINNEIIRENLIKEINLLQSIKEILNHAQVDMKNLKREFVRYRKITKRSATYLKNALNSFNQVSQIYKKESAIIYSITIEEEVAVNWLLKEKDFEMDFEVHKELEKVLGTYFVNNSEKINIILNKLKTVVEELNTSKEICTH